MRRTRTTIPLGDEQRPPEQERLLTEADFLLVHAGHLDQARAVRDLATAYQQSLERERALREASTRAVRHIENARRAQRLTGYPDAQLRQALVELDEALTANPSEQKLVPDGLPLDCGGECLNGQCENCPFD